MSRLLAAVAGRAPYVLGGAGVATAATDPNFSEMLKAWLPGATAALLKPSAEAAVAVVNKADDVQTAVRGLPNTRPLPPPPRPRFFARRRSLHAHRSIAHIE